MPTIQQYLHITIAKPNSITPPNKVKYLITSKSNNTIFKTYIFAPNQPTLLLALRLTNCLKTASAKEVAILQIENLFTNEKLYA